MDDNFAQRHASRFTYSANLSYPTRPLHPTLWLLYEHLHLRPLDGPYDLPWIRRSLSALAERTRSAQLSGHERASLRCEPGFATRNFERPHCVTVVQNITSDLVLVSCAEIEPDGRIHVRNRSGQERSVKEVREALRPLSQDEVCVGQYVCIRGERGVLACRIEKLIEPENNRHQDLYSVTVLTRTPDGQYCKGPEMKRRMVYDFPESFLVRPLNCFKAILAPGQKAMFTQADCIGFNSSAQLNYRDGSNDPSSLVNWNKFVEDLLQLSLALKIPYKAIMKILSRQILRGLLLPPEGMQFRRPLDLNLSTSLS